MRGRRRTPAALTLLALLAVLALLDAALVELSWPLLVFLAVAALAVVALATSHRRRTGAATAAAGLASLAGTLAMGLDDRLLAGSFGLVEAAALVLLLVVRCRHAASTTDVALAGVLAAAAVALPLRIPSSDTPVYLAAMAAVAAVAVAVAVALRASDQQRHAAVTAVRRAEREDVARELHDVVAHHVTGMVVATQAARAVLAADPARVPPVVAPALDAIEAAGSEALGSLRRLVGVLRAEPAPGAPRLPAPGLADLPELVRRFQRAGAAGATELSAPELSALELSAPELRAPEPSAPGGGPDVPAEVQAAVYRVVQESLTNVHRHARGSARVAVDVARTPAAITVQVADSGRVGSGRRLDPEGERGGFGILGMRERVEALGGTLTAGPQPAGGWAVQVVIPLPDCPPRGRASR